jgi:hypothetical protein
MAKQTEQMVPRKNGGTEAQARQGIQLARLNPFALLDELQDELARLWGRPFALGQCCARRDCWLSCHWEHHGWIHLKRTGY